MKGRSQRGIALILGIPLFLTLAVTAYGVIGLGYYYRESSRIQSAIDVSLLGAAAEICSSQECFNQSRKAFLALLKNNLPNEDLNFINLDDINTNGFQETEWKNDKYTFQIERGRWDDKNSKLESIEGDWQSRFPGVSSEFLYFGLKVSFSKKLTTPFGKLNSFSIRIKSSGTTLASLPREQCVAPFAIPVCSLLGDAGSFSENEVCEADRLFTQSDRYCSTESDEANSCGRVPNFSYDPEHKDFELKETLERIFDGHWIPYDDNFDLQMQCFIATPWYKKRTQHFGVVGLPGSMLPNEALLKSVIATGQGCVQTKLGQPFHVLDEGITDVNLAEILWDQISNAKANNAEDASHPPISTLTNSQNPFLVNTDHFFMNGKDIALCGPKNTRKEYGVFGSFRHAFGLWDKFEERITGQGYVECPHTDKTFDSPYWKVKVPVIADMRENAPSCKGILKSKFDPRTSSSTNYEIVGFATVHLYDVGVPKISWDNFPGVISKNSMCAGVYSGVTPQERLPDKPFTFRDSNGDIPNSYIARARLNCGSKTFTSFDDTLPLNSPVLIE